MKIMRMVGCTRLAAKNAVNTSCVLSMKTRQEARQLLRVVHFRFVLQKTFNLRPFNLVVLNMLA